MNKYNNDDIYNDTIHFQLINIANELAETNRLKIIELKLKFYPTGKKISLNELEGITIKGNKK